MRKSWIIGFILFVSIATNITLASVIIGKKVRHHNEPIRTLKHNFDNLPMKGKLQALKVMKEKRPEIHEKMKEMREERKAVFAYIQSEKYNRAEAEKRLEILRQKTEEVQKSVQTMLLDIGDTLPPEQRAELFKRKMRDKGTGKNRQRKMNKE